MGYVTLDFLGKEHMVSDSVNKLMYYYTDMMIPLQEKIVEAVLEDIKSDSENLSFGEQLPEYILENTAFYRDILENYVRVLVINLTSYGIFDITSEDLLENSTAMEDLEKLGYATLERMLSEAKKFAQLQQAGLERAYRSSASSITGSGVTVFSNSLTSLMLYSAIEGSTLLSQAEKADREYKQAVSEINRRTTNALDHMVSEVLVKQYYPAVLKILMESASEITSAFLAQLAVHGKFDIEAIQKYNPKKAAQMLNNISYVSDKYEFLQCVFDVCPFIFELYETCLNQGLLDKGTFETAKYFGFADKLAEKADHYIQANLQDVCLVKPLVPILADYQSSCETVIWNRLYKDTISQIKETYKDFHLALSKKTDLDRFVRKYVAPNTNDIILMTPSEVGSIVQNVVFSVLSPEQYAEFSNLNLLRPDDLRVPQSTSEELAQINKELTDGLISAFSSYIQEAQRRAKLFNESSAQLSEVLKSMQRDLDFLKNEWQKLGFFSFSKKKELEERIKCKEKEMSLLEENHESKKLLKDFEDMYKYV